MVGYCHGALVNFARHNRQLSKTFVVFTNEHEFLSQARYGLWGSSASTPSCGFDSTFPFSIGQVEGEAYLWICF